MKLSITCPTLGPHGARVELDGREITTSLVALRVDLHSERVNTATLTIEVDDLELDVDAAITLQHQLREQPRAVGA